jgi:MRC1-like domain
LRRKGELQEAEYALGEVLPAAPVAQPNAFDALMKPKTKPKGTSAVIHNDFVQGEAEESDDELQLGFAKRRTEEEEEAGIDPEEEAKLVDDTKLTDAQIREDAVVEKHL